MKAKGSGSITLRLEVYSRNAETAIGRLGLKPGETRFQGWPVQKYTHKL